MDSSEVNRTVKCMEIDLFSQCLLVPGKTVCCWTHVFNKNGIISEHLPVLFRIASEMFLDQNQKVELHIS